MRSVPRRFYARDTANVARDLLGKLLVRRIGKTTVSGIITETEAYKHMDDPASHAYNGMTERNRAMFGEVGRAYVYFTYGMHYCVNAVARGKTSAAGAVLIRAVVPHHGIKAMIRNRGNIRDVQRLSDGPAKLTQAMCIDGSLYGADLVSGIDLRVCSMTGHGDEVARPGKICVSTRIGIRKATDKRWNFRLES